MTPILTLWADDIADFVRLRVDSAVAGSVPDAARLYHSVKSAGLQAADIVRTISENFRSQIRLGDIDTTLHVVAVVSLCSDEALADIEKIAKAAAEAPHKVSLHFMLLRHAVCRALQPAVEASEKEPELIGQIAAGAAGSAHTYTYTLIDDYSAEGAPLAFSTASFAEYMAVLLRALIANYHSILSPVLLSDSIGKSISMGFSTVCFDGRYLSRQLLHRTFISALEAAGINADTVDAGRASHMSNTTLDGIEDRFSRFYAGEVSPRFKAGTSETRIVAEIAGPMTAEFDAMRHQLTAFLNDPDLSLPEKEATLALMLGRDNKRLKGVQYDSESHLLDDGLEFPLKEFICAFNDYCPRSGLLPLRGSFKSLKLYRWDNEKQELVEKKENKKAFYPLGEIKELKSEIQNTTAFIRRKSQEVEQLESLSGDRPIGGGDFERQRQYGIVEQPLEETYLPAPGIKARENVDLRSFFSPVRSQGRLGACSSFAVTSIYESIMNRSAAEGAPKADMSEQFVFYHSNVLAGRPEGGSNYFEQLAALGKYGICSEELFGYSEGNVDREPDERAREEALKHRVLKAKQIPLESAGNAMQSVRENHRRLTAALSEGYPVAIALKIYNNFGAKGPFVNRPEDADIASGGEGSHAMVIAGYSEADKCYIVRNSWGPGFGDDGYAYVSMAYIDDPEYCTFACIITETTDDGAHGHADVPHLVAPFAGTETEIKIAVIRNILDGEALRLSSMQEKYRDLYKYYQQTLQQLCNNAVRNELRQAAEKHTAKLVADTMETEAKHHARFAETVKTFKKNYITGALIISGVTACIDVPLLVMILNGNIAGISLAVWIVAAVFTAFAALTWLNYEWSKRRFRRELNGLLEELAVLRKQAQDKLLETQMRYHVAGMWIDNFHDLAISMERIYDKLCTYNSHLHSWYKDDCRMLAEPGPAAGPMFSRLENPELTEQYYRTNAAGIVGGIDLVDTFWHFAQDAESIGEARTRIETQALQQIERLFEDFSMTDYLSGAVRYPYLEDPYLEDMVRTMIATGSVSTFHRTTSAGAPTRILLMDIDDRSIDAWRSRADAYFPFPPAIGIQADRYTATIFTVVGVPVEAIK